MANFTSQAQAEQRAIDKQADGTWTEAHGTQLQGAPVEHRGPPHEGGFYAANLLTVKMQ